MSDDDATFERLLADAEATHLRGWDWSAVATRYLEDDPPWDYRAEVEARLPGARSLLDLGTGGGELLSGLSPRPRDTWATEGYPPNLPLARARLQPLGISVVAVEDDRLPFPDARFDLVIARHESYDPAEIRRVLRPGGVFLTQQVGGRDHDLLSAALRERPTSSFPDWRADAAAAGLRDAGLDVFDVREALCPARFVDLGAVVFFLRATPWQVPGFDLARERPRLRALHSRMQREGGLASRIDRFLLVARRL